MKCENNIWWMFIFLSFVVLAKTQIGYCEKSHDKTSIEEVKQETEDLIEALKGYTAEQQDKAIQKIQMALVKLDKRIDEQEARIDREWDKMNKSAREKARAKLKELHKKRVKVAEWYGSLRTSSIKAWEHMKKGFSDAYKDLYDAWEKSEKEF